MVLKGYQEDIADIANKLFNLSGNQKIFLLEGAMGSGKTTLIKGLCSRLGVVDMVYSPTFSLINEYKTQDRGVVFHFDCYRLNNIEEAVYLDFESYFTSGSYCFVEWASKIKPILPLNYFLIHLEIETNKSRVLFCSNH